MSHFTAVKGAIPVSQKATLVKALQELGLNPEVGSRIEMKGHYVENGYDKTNNNYAQIVVRSASIESATGKKLRSSTDLGFRETDNGTYEIVVDDYSLGREMSEKAFTLEVNKRAVGIGLKQAISYAYGVETARSLGATVKMNGLDVIMQPSSVMIDDCVNANQAEIHAVV